MNPEFYSLHMILTGGLDTNDFAFNVGRRFGHSIYAGLYILELLVGLAYEENA